MLPKCESNNTDRLSIMVKKLSLIETPSKKARVDSDGKRLMEGIVAKLGQIAYKNLILGQACSLPVTVLHANIICNWGRLWTNSTPCCIHWCFDV